MTRQERRAFAVLSPQIHLPRPIGDPIQVIVLPTRCGGGPGCRSSAWSPRRAAAQVACAQDIAGDGVHAAAMFVDLAAELERGAWAYRRLFWETGALRQLLYLEAEALGISATGIGCFFDESARGLLGLDDPGLRSLYHFTIGGRLDDPRVRTIDAYHHLRGVDPSSA